MNDFKKAQPIAVAYKVIDLKQAFSVAHEHHTSQALIHPMGEQGMHEMFAKLATESLQAIETERWTDNDVIMFSDIPSEFTTATNSPQQGLKTFLDYYKANRIAVIPAKDAIRLIPR